MMEKKLKELDIEIIGGQIMSRIIASTESGEEGENIRVIIPKSIKPDGSINESDLAEEIIKIIPDQSRITRAGDIVLKLSTPYNAGRVDENTIKCVVPSFCAIIRNNSNLYDNYLLAFLNSSTCRKQLAASVAGGRIGFVSVGKVRDVKVPIPDPKTQVAIGQSFIETQDKIKTITKIMELETKKNDIYFRELTKG